ncbi:MULTISPECIES: endolytic transglycosylase MltG [unclassified Agarivorans]|uniref:endolytic transglycosylase MltG n=1 Tax=unclassified Agarivorans TaxID=2636026 RepID=UPI0010DA3771|nr:MULTISPECIES: endolytic transglycosylase MltG [unclassified Agarivorans]MDO6686002.1 endolytic transglycosylase MltG [Agarivorans sp. 3_MG-2023]MDO6713860.1 endolytic transglycosylase MltG [Agarivorans sp. 2_MG-2023]MDO6762192.1 endolytic transglycosylase MltG [Agarivorans sp. 1_MG-2023]GDY26137.1 aminodeoxychorismate lyase [Agarivorans sp. Toyoura001]
MFRKLVVIVLLFSLAGFAAYTWFDDYLNTQWQEARDTQLEQIEVSSGDNFYRVAQNVFLDAEQDNWWLRVWFKLHPQHSQIKTGHYQLPPELSYAQLTDILASGKVVQLKVSLIEGETYTQFWQKLNQTKGIKASSKTEQELLTWLGSEFTKLEGLLLPETYFFVHGTPAENIIKRSFVAQEKVIAEQWDKRNKKVPLKSPYEALILASIIEKETGAKFERPRIASVFVNRLNKGMRLQTDPTVIYGMGERYDGNIRRKDLREATAYNTYVIRALPPTPIAMASEDAIIAALNPEKSNYYYFVAKGGGEHYFSKNLAEHNRAVRKYILKK